MTQGSTYFHSDDKMTQGSIHGFLGGDWEVKGRMIYILPGLFIVVDSSVHLLQCVVRIPPGVLLLYVC